MSTQLLILSSYYFIIKSLIYSGNVVYFSKNDNEF